MARTALFVALATSSLVAGGLSCGPDTDDCTVTLTCPTGTGSGGSAQGGNTAQTGGGGTGGTSSTGGGGGVSDTCGNAIVEPGELCFTEPFASYPTGREGAVAMVLFDCDGDSDLDVMTANIGSFNASALRNNGSGVFTELSQSFNFPNGPVTIAQGNIGTNSAPAITVTYDDATYVDIYLLNSDCTVNSGGVAYPMAMGTSDVAVLDVDGMGAEDIVAIKGSSLATILNVASSTDVVGANTSESHGITVGDIDGDNDADVVIADFANNKVRWAINNNGAFAGAPQNGDVGDGPYDVALGDVDGDMDLDIVSVNRTANSISVLRNSGSGTFSLVLGDASVQGGGSLDASQPRSLALDDVDSDGDIDVVTANSNDSTGKSSVSLLLNDGTGVFTLAPGFPLEVGVQPHGIGVGDLNGDGAPDIVTSSAFVDNGSSSVSALLQAP